MDNFQLYPYADYAEIIERLDIEADGLSKKAVDFIASLLDDPPKYLTRKQVEWLEDLEDNYL